MSHEALQKRIVLRKKEHHRIVSGHPWVFSNEIQEVKGNPAIGDIVEVTSSHGRSLGVGFFNPHSLIAVRLLSRKVEDTGPEFFRQRLQAAWDLRRRMFPEADAVRVVHGESDFLPGLIVDKYRDCLAIQALSYGMDHRLPMLCDLLEELFHPRAIVARNESTLRTLEGLPQVTSTLRGSVEPVTITEHGIRYTIDMVGGQKTGFFLDQRENRSAIRRYCPGAEVLDCFCNDGGFALNACAAGATRVEGMDISPEAIQRAEQNARDNGITSVRFRSADVFGALQAESESSRYDVIVLDPPSFTRSKKNVVTAKQGYRELHRSALRILRPDGILATASCSHHIEPQVFLDIVDETATKMGRRLQMLEWHGASPDHPTLPAVPETQYLKFGVFLVR